MTDTTDTQGRASPCKARHDDIVVWLAKGLSRREMAIEMGVTTNVVISYIYRHVPAEIARTRRRNTQRAPKPAPAKPKVERRGGSKFKLAAREKPATLRFGRAPALEGPRPPASASAAKVAERSKHVPAGPRVAFMDLERGDRKCRWPVPGTSGAAMMCCGAQAAPGESYCKECHRVGWMPRVRVAS